MSNFNKKWTEEKTAKSLELIPVSSKWSASECTDFSRCQLSDLLLEVIESYTPCASVDEIVAAQDLSVSQEVRCA